MIRPVAGKARDDMQAASDSPPCAPQAAPSGRHVVPAIAIRIETVFAFRSSLANRPTEQALKRTAPPACVDLSQVTAGNHRLGPLRQPFEGRQRPALPLRRAAVRVERPGPGACTDSLDRTRTSGALTKPGRYDYVDRTSSDCESQACVSKLLQLSGS